MRGLRSGSHLILLVLAFTFLPNLTHATSPVFLDTNFFGPKKYSPNSGKTSAVRDSFAVQDGSIAAYNWSFGDGSAGTGLVSLMERLKIDAFL